MSHLTADQFVDVAEGAVPEADMPHLASCAGCRRQLADLRAVMTAAGSVEAPEPSPLYWDQLSARVHDAVASESARRRSWRERWLQPRVWVPALGGALVVALLVAWEWRAPQVSSEPIPQIASIPAAPVPSLPKLEPPLPPLGASDDPQLRLVADYGSTLGWDEMRDEIALDPPSASSDAVVDSLTVDEQRELQRLLADEMTQPAVPENRS